MTAATSQNRVSGGRSRPAHPKPGFWVLTLGSIGVVYGDIGTSPLYAFRESVVAAAGPGNPANETVVLGILSLIIWALILIVTVKYVVILLRADNNGEGGTLALMALAQRAVGARGAAIVILLGIISGALFYGDAIITPALECDEAGRAAAIYDAEIDSLRLLPRDGMLRILLVELVGRNTQQTGR